MAVFSQCLPQLCRCTLPALLCFVVVFPTAHGQTTPVEGMRGMVASAHVLASEAGAQTLRKGGNAVDAAVSVGLALAVVYPRAGNLGGGGFMLIRQADGTAEVIDFREVAPAGARREMYLDASGQVVPEASLVGPLAAGVPGTVAGFGMAHARHGRLPWRDLFEPALRLAKGFPVTTGLARDLSSQEAQLSRFPETRRVYLRDGKVPVPGEEFSQPDLAATLALIAAEGAQEFYLGHTASLIARHVQEAGGLITLKDLADYRPVVREPLRARYRDCEVLTMPPPSSGGVALLQMLHMSEARQSWQLPHASAGRYHFLAECMKRAFRDRAEYLGDPGFVSVPVKELIDPAYAARRIADFDPAKATPSERIEPGLGPWQRRPPAGQESEETTHYSIVDAEGNAVSVTYTLNGLFGSSFTVPGTGILLNNQMDDFTSRPGTPNLFGLIQGEANAIEPRKRPLSSMTPTIVVRDGVPVLVTGSPGGPTIINTVLQVVLNHIDLHMNLQQAVSASRIHHQWMSDELQHESHGMSLETRDALVALGHRVAVRGVPGYDPLSPVQRSIGAADSVGIDPVSRRSRGAADARSRDGAAVAE